MALAAIAVLGGCWGLPPEIGGRGADQIPRPVRRLAAYCASDPAKQVQACVDLARSGDGSWLSALRATGDVNAELAVVQAAEVAPAAGGDLRWVFKTPPGQVAADDALQDLEAGGVTRTFGLALLCRDACVGFRRSLETRLAEWMDRDWHRACAAAAALGLMGAPESEPVLLSAVRQRRSWMLTIVAARALRRLRMVTDANDAAVSLVAHEHWDWAVRHAAKVAMLWWTAGKGYKSVSREVDAAWTGYGELGLQIESVFRQRDNVPYRAGSSKQLVDQPQMRCVSARVEGGPLASFLWDGERQTLGSRDRVKLRALVAEDRQRIWIPGHGLHDRSRIADDSSIAPYVLVSADFPAYRILWPTTIVYSWSYQGEGRVSLRPVAEVPGEPMSARVREGALLLLTTSVAVAVDPGGVTGSLCSAARKDMHALAYRRADIAP